MTIAFIKPQYSRIVISARRVPVVILVITGVEGTPNMSQKTLAVTGFYMIFAGLLNSSPEIAMIPPVVEAAELPRPLVAVTVQE